MLILTADEVRKALPMREAIDAMKRAYAALSGGRAEVPLRTHLTVSPHNAASLFMPAFVQMDDGEALAVKVVSLFPDNPKRGLAFIQAAVLALEADTGRAVALLEGSSLTAIRTGAGSGAAIDELSRPESRTAAVFGAGVQGRTQLEAACAVRRIETAWVYDPDPKQAQKFVAEMAGKSGIPQDLRIAGSPGEAVSQADVVCTATTATRPVFAAGDVRPGTHISAVGSYTPGMQEIPSDIVKRAYVVVDSRSAALAETGDLLQPIQAGLFGEDHIRAELGEILLGQKPGRTSEDQITFFKSVGVAVQDAVAAHLALRNADKMKIGQQVNW
ncbi:MAG: ornithine cyclodeaminase family protein [Chloroflexota bacterium]